MGDHENDSGKRRPHQKDGLIISKVIKEPHDCLENKCSGLRKQGLRGRGERDVFQEASVTKITSKQVGGGRWRKV